MKKLKGVMINGEWLGEGFVINPKFRAICDISPQIMSEFIKMTKEIGYKENIEINSFDFINKDTIKIDFIKDKQEEISANLTFEKSNNLLKLVSKNINDSQKNKTILDSRQEEYIEQINNESLVHDNLPIQEPDMDKVDYNKFSDIAEEKVSNIDKIQDIAETNNETPEKTLFETKKDALEVFANLEEISEKFIEEDVLPKPPLNIIEKQISDLPEENITNTNNIKESTNQAVIKTVSNTVEVQPNNMNPIHITVELQQPQVQQTQFIPQPQYIPQPHFIQQPMPIIMPQNQALREAENLEQGKASKENKKKSYAKFSSNKNLETEALEKEEKVLDNDKQIEESKISSNEAFFEDIIENTKEEVLLEDSSQNTASEAEDNYLKNKEVITEEKKDSVETHKNEEFFKEIEALESQELNVLEDFDFASLDHKEEDKKEESYIENLDEELLKLKEEFEAEKLNAQVAEISNNVSQEIQEEIEHYKEELSTILPLDQNPENFMIQALLTEMMSLKEEISVLKAEAVKKITVEEFFGDKEKSVVKAEDADFKILSSNEKHNAAILDDEVFFAGEKLYKWGDTLYLKD